MKVSLCILRVFFGRFMLTLLVCAAFVVPLWAQIDLGTGAGEVDAALKANSIGGDADEDGYWWLIPETYNATDTTIGDYIENVFNGSLGIGEGVTLNAKATTNHSIGLRINGSITQTGDSTAIIRATNSSTDDGKAYGIYIKEGNFTTENSFVKFSATNSSNSDAFGTYLEKGDFNLKSGTVIATAKNTAAGWTVGIALNKDFYMTGGTLIAKAYESGGGASDESNADGVFLNSGNFYLSGGQIKIKSTLNNSVDNGISAGIFLWGEDYFNAGDEYDGGKFIMTGGAIDAKVMNKSDNIGCAYGIYAANGFTLENGLINLDVKNRGLDWSIGIYVDNGDFNMNGGKIVAKSETTGDGRTYGIYIYNGDFNMTGGVIKLDAASLGGDRARGIQVNGGKFNMDGGKIIAKVNNTADGWASGMIVTDDFNMTAGKLIAKVNNAGNGIAEGVNIYGNNFNLSSGKVKLDVTSESTHKNATTYGIHLMGATDWWNNLGYNADYYDGGKFIMAGGMLDAKVTKKGEDIGYTYGIFAKNGFNMSNGVILLDIANFGTATNTDYDNIADGIFVGDRDVTTADDAIFTMSAGTLFAKIRTEGAGNGEAIGIDAKNGFVFERGFLFSDAANNGNGYALGMNIDYGDFVMKGGKMVALAQNTINGMAYGLYSDSGNFIMERGIIALNVSLNDIDNYGEVYGIRLFGKDYLGLGVDYDGGKFIMTGGAINMAVASTGSGQGVALGIYAKNGFSMANGFIDLDVKKDSSNSAVYGINIGVGDFDMKSGKIIAKVNGTDGLGLTRGVGIYVSNGDFNIESGKINIDAALNADGEGDIYGIKINAGDFNMENGEVTIAAHNTSGGKARGIYVTDGSFYMTDGKINITVENNGNDGRARGILVNKQFIMEAGELNAKATSTGTGRGYGIYVVGEEFIQRGGTVHATGTGKGSSVAIGIYTAADDYIQNSGIIYALGMGANGYGVYAGQRFTQNAGTLYLMPGSGFSVVAEYTTNLKGTLRPGVDLLSGSHGYLYGGDKGSGVNIEKSTAKLVPYLVNSIALELDEQKKILFLTDASSSLSGSNTFNKPQNTVTMRYGTKIDAAADYYLTVTRENRVSDVVSGDAKKIATFMEYNSESILERARKNNKFYANLIELYSAADMSYNVKDAEDFLRGEMLIPDTATARLNAISEQMLDMTDSALSNRLEVLNNNTELLSLTATTRDAFWVTPLGTVMNFYPNEYLSRAIYYGAGLNAGFAGYLNNSASYGIGVTYLNGYYDSGNIDFDKFDTAFLTASLGYRAALSNAWLEGKLSYGNNSVDAYDSFSENRSEAYRASVKSGMNLASGSWIFTPALGIDYTYYDYDKPMMDDGLISLTVNDIDSLRPLAEIGAKYNFRNVTSFGVKIGYSYEALGQGIVQEIDLNEETIVPFKVKTDRSPRHNGHVALDVNRYITDAFSFVGEYDLQINDLVTINDFKLTLKLLY